MSRRRLVIDTFPINNEMDLLECRLEEMAPAVDFFVAVEAEVDHQDNPKPFHLSHNVARFDRWRDKLIVVQARGLPTKEQDGDPWARELAQREYALEGLQTINEMVPLQADDLILHGDVDEICRAMFVRHCRPKRGFVTFGQRLHCFAVDWQHPDEWGGTVAATMEQLTTLGIGAFQKLRNTRNSNADVLHESGWHLSWLGGQEAAMAKLGSFCHPEIAERTLHGLTTDLYLREGFHVDGRRMAPVDVDGDWPAFIAERRCPDVWFRPRAVAA
jgi:beta-1,4-mannosyl-glycoprotein beta-1,4-N-acetylglucosaminyltransferase